jgi:predicted component of type VI protein secretion system
VLVAGQWAEPDVLKLKLIMRHVTRNIDEAKARGLAARERMLDRFSPQAMSVKLGHEFKRIERLLAARKHNATAVASDP